MNPNVPEGAARLLNFIGKLETGRTDASAYEVIVFFKQSKLPKPLTEYTIDELLAAQKTWAKNWKGSAAGKYQIIRKTLLGLVEQLGIPGSTKFTPDVQDRLGFQLLNNRGWQAFVSRQVTVGAYALQLAKEWASIPVLVSTQGAHRVVTRGQSYYAGDGVNKAHADPKEFEALLASVRPGMEPAKPGAEVGSAPPKPATPPAPEPAKPRDTRGIVGWIILAAVGIASGAAALWQHIANFFGGLF